MANYCSFNMKVTGDIDSINEIFEMMQWKGKFEENGLGRIYDIETYDSILYPNGLASYFFSGDCAWSVHSAMRSDSGRREVSLESESKRLGLMIEVFSEESGFAFQEHVLINKGEILIDDCVDYEEHWTGEFDSLEEYNNEYETDFTEDMVDDGYVYIGGFDNYGDFENHFSYFKVLLSVDDLTVPV